MKKENLKKWMLGLSGLAALALVACSPKAETPVTEVVGAAEIPMLEAKPESAIKVQAALVNLKPGDEAVVSGQIGGVVEPFFDGFAGFVLADTDLVFCDEMAEPDHCPTPWDACCEDPDLMKKSRISVQLVDATGMPLSLNLQGQEGLAPNAKVIVAGHVAESSTADNLILNATGFYTGE